MSLLTARNARRSIKDVQLVVTDCAPTQTALRRRQPITIRIKADRKVGRAVPARRSSLGTPGPTLYPGNPEKIVAKLISGSRIGMDCSFVSSAQGDYSTYHVLNARGVWQNKSVPEAIYLL